MSRDHKYIGMDVHKEAVVINVLNSSGKLVMESIVETLASSILQFIHGLRGELHVTWEEGIGRHGTAARKDSGSAATTGIGTRFGMDVANLDLVGKPRNYTIGASKEPSDVVLS